MKCLTIIIQHIRQALAVFEHLSNYLFQHIYENYQGRAETFFLLRCIDIGHLTCLTLQIVILDHQNSGTSLYGKRVTADSPTITLMNVSNESHALLKIGGGKY